MIPNTSFIERTAPAQWISGQVPEWPVRYALYKKYHILNTEVQVEDEKRGLVAEDAPTGQPKRHKKHKTSRPATVNPLSIIVAEGSPSTAAKLVPQGPSST